MLHRFQQFAHLRPSRKLRQQFADLLQIAGKEQEVPEIVLGGILIIIGDIDIRREISVMLDILHLLPDGSLKDNIFCGHPLPPVFE